MLELTLATLADTARLGRRLAHALGAAPAVRLLLLRGELGTGKTSLTRALVERLPGGDAAEVASPSFTLCNCYPTTPPVLHADLYRCPNALPDELWEALDTVACAPVTGNIPNIHNNPPPLLIVEWAEYLPEAALPTDFLDIRLHMCHTVRLAQVEGHGSAAKALVARLLNEDWTQS